MTGEILCLDASYGPAAAAVAGAVIAGWGAETAKHLLVQRIEGPPAPYQPGAFYKRELPLLLPMIAAVDDPIRMIVIDGYVWLDAQERPGLGGRLFTSLGSRIPVIGVAKTPYRDDTWSIPIRRARSKRPLFVTAAGIEQQDAARCIHDMHGAHRVPTILALVDRAARGGLMGRQPDP